MVTFKIYCKRTRSCPSDWSKPVSETWWWPGARRPKPVVVNIYFIILSVVNRRCNKGICKTHINCNYCLKNNCSLHYTVRSINALRENNRYLFRLIRKTLRLRSQRMRGQSRNLYALCSGSTHMVTKASGYDVRNNQEMCFSFGKRLKIHGEVTDEDILIHH